MEDKPLTALSAMERLQPFVGKWKTKGAIQAPNGTGMRLDAIDTYEWLPGGFSSSTMWMAAWEKTK